MSSKPRYLVTIGTFDGVHRGHRKLLAWVIARAKRLKLKTRVVFFVFPPRFHFRPDESAPALTTSRDRRAFIRSLGIDRVEVLRFGPRWAGMSHDRFFDDHIVRRWKAGGLLVGRDFAFGKGRRGNLAYLRKACAQRALHLGVLPLMRVGGRKISSSVIRRLLLRGKVEEAAKLLGRGYSLTGKVVRGKGIGRKLGAPTANLKVSRGLLIPHGVFRVRARALGWRAPKTGVCNIGIRPTFDRRRKTAGGRRSSPSIEVHLPGFSGGLYGRRLTIEFLKKIRGERRFPSLNALRRAIQRDIASIS